MRNDPNSNANTPQGVVDPFEYTANAWLAFVRAPEDDAAIETLMVEIGAGVGRLLRAGTMGGFFTSFEEDIIQESRLLLFNHYLTGNRKLLEATRSGPHPDLNLQILRSLWVAMQATMWRMRTTCRNSAQTATALSTPDSTAGTVARDQQARERLRQAVCELGLKPAP